MLDDTYLIVENVNTMCVTKWAFNITHDGVSAPNFTICSLPPPLVIDYVYYCTDIVHAVMHHLWLVTLAGQYYYRYCVMCKSMLKCPLGLLARLAVYRRVIYWQPQYIFLCCGRYISKFNYWNWHQNFDLHITVKGLNYPFRGQNWTISLNQLITYFMLVLFLLPAVLHWTVFKLHAYVLLPVFCL